MTHASHSFQIELDLSRDWGGEIRCDIIWALRHVASQPTEQGWTVRYARRELTKGVDLTNPEVAKLIANIMDFVGSDAEVALDDVRRERVG